MSWTLDGSGGGVAATGTTAAGVISTTLTDDIIVAVITCAHNAYVKSVAGGGLTWARHRYKHITSSGSQDLGIEVWWAHAATALTTQTITATFSAAMYATIEIFAVNGADLYTPFDPNASLPANSAFAGSGGSNNHTVSGISTTNPNTFEFAVLATSASPGATKTADGGWTLISSRYDAAGSGDIEYVINTSPVSGASQNVFTSYVVSTDYIALVDALQAPITHAEPVYVNAAAPTMVSAAATITIGLPGNRVNGNLLVAHLSISSSTATAVWPAGWTQIENWTIGSQNGSSAYCYVTGSEAAPVVTWTGSSGAMGRVDQFAHTAPTSPIGATSHNSTTSGSITTAAITSTRANSLILNYKDLGYGGAFVLAIPPLPTPYTNYQDGFNAAPAAEWKIGTEALPTPGTVSDSVSLTASNGVSAVYLDFLAEILAPVVSSSFVVIVG